jgi:hypothetical protein
MIDIGVMWLSAKEQAKEVWANSPKLSGWGLLGAALMGIFLLSAPAAAVSVLYKFSVVVFGLVILYWLNRHMAPTSRPSQFLDSVGKVKEGQEIPYAAALMHRALVTGAGIIALALIV